MTYNRGRLTERKMIVCCSSIFSVKKGIEQKLN